MHVTNFLINIFNQRQQCKKQMKLTITQLRRIIKEEVEEVANKKEQNRPGRFGPKQTEADAERDAAEDAKERKPVPDRAVKHVVDNYYDKTAGKGKWWQMSMDDAVEELLTSYGYKTPGENHVDYTDLDQVKDVLRKDNRYKTTGGATSESTRSLRRLLRDYLK